MASREKILFVSTNEFAPWGGSEALWSQTALWLASAGISVSANLLGWSERAPQVEQLIKSGIAIQERLAAPGPLTPNAIHSLCSGIYRRISYSAFSVSLNKIRPDLICLSLGSAADDLSLVDRCIKSGIPYVLLIQAHAEHLWPADRHVTARIAAFRGAKRIYFVSKGNRRLVETQFGVELENAEVVRNPFNVRWDAAPPWPTKIGPIRLACVARLEPPAKGQDMLFHLMTSEAWQKRDVEVSLFGKGPMEQSLRRLADRLDINKKVQFHGHVENIENVWTEHHALILPSRFEGLPLALVEAMLCGRISIATDVAGNAELIEDGVTGFIAEAPTQRHLNDALERAWDRRSEWKLMGEAAAKSIRTQITENPAADFGQKLLSLLGRN